MEKKFRHMPEQGFPQHLFASQLHPIILISNDISTYCNLNEEKKYVLMNKTDNETLLWIWPGKIKSDVFEIRKEDIGTLIPLLN